MTDQESQGEANKMSARPDTARSLAERLPSFHCKFLTGMSLHFPERTRLSIETHQVGICQWTKTVLQTETEAADRDGDSSHQYGDMLAITATQWSARGRGYKACADHIAAHSMHGFHLDRYAARAVNPVIRAARQHARERIVSLVTRDLESERSVI